MAGVFPISIHAPHEGGDGGILDLVGDYAISIHAPHEGGDASGSVRPLFHFIFQSTPPTRGATRAAVCGHCSTSYFNPRPPRGGRLEKWVRVADKAVFQSTPPTRGATQGVCQRCGKEQFQSTPPTRGATVYQKVKNRRYVFQSTPPTRGATVDCAAAAQAIIISIHAPHEGGDKERRCNRGFSGYFNPRPPRGGRPCRQIFTGSPCIFQSTPPTRGATGAGRYFWHHVRHFNPRPPRGGRQQRCTVLPADL